MRSAKAYGKRKLNVMIISATDKIGGPGKGIFQFLRYADHNRFNYILCNYKLRGKSVTAYEFGGKAKAQNVSVNILKQAARIDPSLIHKAINIIRKKNINLVQTHGYKSNILGCLLKIVYGIPWIAFAHGYTSENLKMISYKKIDLFCYRFADKAVAVSNSLKKSLIKNGVRESKVTTIHNAMDMDDLIHCKSAQHIRKELGLSDTEKVIGVIGRLSPEKGQKVFLKAFKILAENLHDIKAIIIGDGQEESSLKNYCASNGLKNKVIFTGYRDNIADYYQIMNLVVIPSYSEGLPNVLLEAMVLGIPVLATRVGGICEVLSNNDGVLLRPGDHIEMANEMLALLNDEDRRTSYKMKSQDIIFSRFDPVSRTKKIEDLIYSVLEA